VFESGVHGVPHLSAETTTAERLRILCEILTVEPRRTSRSNMSLDR
jgi:hypothetical protein